MNMVLDASGEALIKRFEGFSDIVYLDKASIPTIGWGHRDGVTLSTPRITILQAEAFFQDDVKPAEQAVNDSVTISLTRNQFSVLVSFVFNEGVRAFEHSHLLKAINQNDTVRIREEFSRWIYIHVDGKTVISQDLIKRRKIECDLFFSTD